MQPPKIEIIPARPAVCRDEASRIGCPGADHSAGPGSSFPQAAHQPGDRAGSFGLDGHGTEDGARARSGDLRRQSVAADRPGEHHDLR